jgi:hypothetical protein
MADSGTFDVTPEQWIRVKSAVLAKTSIAITTDSGEASAKGLTISWNYADGKLLITVLKHAWYDPSLETIDADISDMIADATA